MPRACGGAEQGEFIAQKDQCVCSPGGEEGEWLRRPKESLEPLWQAGPCGIEKEFPPYPMSTPKVI